MDLGLDLIDPRSTSHLNNLVVYDKAHVSRKVDLVEWDGYLRLASPNLETWAAYDGLRPLSSLHSEAVNWPVRMERHCQYMADKVSSCLKKIVRCEF